MCQLIFLKEFAYRILDYLQRKTNPTSVGLECVTYAKDQKDVSTPKYVL